MTPEPARSRLRALFDAIKRVDSPTILHATLFAVLSVFTIAMLYRAPLGPGQDYHYHVMSAAMGARPSSEPLRALYHGIHPFDANTLLYRVAWPFIRLFGAVRGFQCAVAVMFYLGFPAATWYALWRVKRAPWPSLLAFAVIYSRGWAVDGFVPFMCSSSLMVLVLAEWSAFLQPDADRSYRAMARGALFAALLFLSHAHTFAWSAVMMGLFTVAAAGRELFTQREDGPRFSIRPALELALKSLAMIAPAALLLLSWKARIETYAPPLPASATPAPAAYAGLDVMLKNGLLAFPQYFAPLYDPTDVRFAAGLAVIALVLLLLVRQDPENPRYFEAFSIATFCSFLVLPLDMNGQSIGPRHMEFFMWTLPLVLWRRTSVKLRDEAGQSWRSFSSEAIIALALCAFSALRIHSIERAMVGLNRNELGPLLALEEPCRRARRTPYSILAYVPMATTSTYFPSLTMHQAHETLAAICGVETPVYNTRVRPFHTPPIRYRVDMPAPIGIYPGASEWYTDSAAVLRHYDLVLTYDWHPDASEQPEIDRVVSLVARSGRYALYRRR
ncbi:MAG: hypothetical protein U0269_13865 [Polyangiales bacterium]